MIIVALMEPPTLLNPRNEKCSPDPLCLQELGICAKLARGARRLISTIQDKVGVVTTSKLSRSKLPNQEEPKKACTKTNNN